MPAPKVELFTALVSAKIPNQSPYTAAFIKSLCNEICVGWQDWIDSMRWGHLKVIGSGTPGPWVGTGALGQITASPYAFSVDRVIDGAGFRVRTPGTMKFLLSLDAVMGRKFDKWKDSYIFAAVPYTGFLLGPAINIPGTLVTYGNGVLPSNIKTEWEAKLEDEETVSFKLSEPQCHAKIFTGAVASTVESEFVTSFLTLTMGVKNLTIGAPLTYTKLDGKFL